MRPHPWLIVVLVGAAVGLVFAGVSTYDFVQHLDRQVHSLHCSFIPGGGHEGVTSGCQVAMMSPYSSVLRTHVWGGIPIALPAMAVFAFIGCFAIDLLVTRRKDDVRATAFLALATVLPALASIVMAVISLSKLGTTCKLCVAIYLASAACLVGAIGLWRRALRLRREGPDRVDPHSATVRGDDPAWVGASKEPESRARLLEVQVEAPPASNGFLASAFAIGVGFVAVPVVLYLAMAPSHARFIGTCGGLVKPADTYGVMVRVKPPVTGGASTIEILDPLCPACKAFEDRLSGASAADRLDRKAILFPLDNTCNWMVTEATHPGACTVSEAVLCAGDRSPEVIEWAFAAQDRIRAAAKTDPTAAARIVNARFPEFAQCVGSPEARSRLNKSLRWAVANNIHVLTPQLFVDNVKLCDEDVDLGLEYALDVMLERRAAGTLVATPPVGGVTPVPALAPEPSPDRAAPPPPPATDKTPTEKPATPTPTPPTPDRPATEPPATEPPTQEPPVEPPPTEPPPTETPSTGPATTPSDTPVDPAPPTPPGGPS